MDNPAAYLADLPIADVRFFPRTGSTNDEAWQWLESGAKDMSIVIANEQTNGRGRMSRRWYTTPDSGLAFSIILSQLGQGIPQLSQNMARLTAIGALAVCDALAGKFRLEAKIKWPNDVLVKGRKICGILVEAQWLGDQLGAAIMGIGINVTPSAIPASLELNFPATCLQDCLTDSPEEHLPIDRWALLHDVIERILHWRPLLHSILFSHAWEERLAYRNEWIRVDQDYEGWEGQEPSPFIEGKLLGMTPNGALQLLNRAGKLINVQSGEIHLLPPVNDKSQKSTSSSSN